MTEVPDTLRARGLDVDVQPATDVDGLNARDELAPRPLAVFAMGPAAAEPADFAHSRVQLDRALSAESVANVLGSR